MKKILFLFIVMLFAFGCLGGGGKKETDYIPDKADVYMLMDNHAMLSDPDFKKWGDSFKDQLNNWTLDDTTIDPNMITKSIFFMGFGGINFEKLSSADYYWGAISFSSKDFDQNKIIGKYREIVAVEEESYEGITIFKFTLTSKEIYKENAPLRQEMMVNDMKVATAFLDSRTKVDGNINAVKDVIDVSKGKKSPLKDERLDKAVGQVGAGSMLVFAMRTPPSFEQTFNDLQKGAGTSSPLDISPMGKLTHIAASYQKEGTAVSFKSSFLFKTDNDAEKVKDLLDGMLSMYRGFSKQGSAMEQVLKAIKIEAKEDAMLLTLDTSKDTIDRFQKELEDMGTAYSKPGNNLGGKEYINQVSGNVVLVAIRGNTNSEKTRVISLNATITAAAGAGRLDLSQMVVKVNNGGDNDVLVYSPEGAKAGSRFDITEVRDPTNLFTKNTPVIDGSSLVQLNIPLTGSADLPVRTSYVMEIIPERGAPTIVEGVTPAKYSTIIQQLYP